MKNILSLEEIIELLDSDEAFIIPFGEMPQVAIDEGPMRFLYRLTFSEDKEPYYERYCGFKYETKPN